MLGVVQSGAGTTGNARIATKGTATCDFDGATTAGHYVTISTVTAGKCADAGTERPTNAQVLGYVTSTNGGPGAYTVLLEPDMVPANLWHTWTITVADGHWYINGVEDAALEADDSQLITLAVLPSRYVVSVPPQMETVVACVGADTITAEIATPTFAFTDFAYDLTLAVVDANVATTHAGRYSKASEDLYLVVAVSGEAKTVADIAAGCSVKVQAKWEVLP
jgi:hypothetical protein